MSVEDVKAEIRGGLQELEGAPYDELKEGWRAQGNLATTFETKVKEALEALAAAKDHLATEVGATLLRTQAMTQSGSSRIANALQGSSTEAANTVVAATSRVSAADERLGETARLMNEAYESIETVLGHVAVGAKDLVAYPTIANAAVDEQIADTGRLRDAANSYLESQ